MQDKPLDRAELDLLSVVQTLHSANGPFARNMLSVAARGRGFEVARPLGRLKTLGLVEEINQKPFFLKRLFGAKTLVLLRPTAAGLAYVTGPQGEVPAPAADLPEAVMPPDSQPDSQPETLPAATAEAAAATPAIATPAPDVTAPGQAPADVAAPDAAPADPVAANPVAAALPDAPADTATAAEAVPATPAPAFSPAAFSPDPQALPVLPDPVLPEPAAEVPAELPMPDPYPVPPPPPLTVADVAPVSPAPAPRPVRLPLDAYTDVLGGIPDDMPATPRMPAVDPDMLEGLRDMLQVLGMELTMAGEALIAQRMAKGATAGEALSQVVLFAFGHAVRYDVLSEGAVQALGLNDYAVEVMRELEKLRDAGEIGAEAFEQDMRLLWALVDDRENRAQLAEDLLTDPMGGAAPTALLPEDLRGGEDASDD